MKVALICSLFFSEGYGIKSSYLDCLKFLFKSAKKYFLPNHEVEFLLITNNDSIKIDTLDYVKLIKVNHYIHNEWHGYLMKVLSVEYVPKKYDYIFSLDVDQIFVNEVTDEDLLHNDFILTKHWCNPTYASILDEVTPFISVNFKAEDYFWALGSFFGGKSKNMYELFEQSNKIHNELFNKKILENCHFYTKYPEELFIGKYVYENNIDYQFLLGSLGFDEEPDKTFFLGDFEQLYRKYIKNNNDETLFQNITNIKLLHQTKVNIEALNILSKYYI